MIAIDLDRPSFAGALHDPLAAVVFCAVGRVTHSWVGGRRVVDNERLVGVDETALVRHHNALATALVT